MRKQPYRIKRYSHQVLWQPGSSREPMSVFNQAEGGEWCKSDSVEVLEARLARFESPGILDRIWQWLFGRRAPAAE